MGKDADEAAFFGEGSGRIHTVQPLRDLESNWAVDLAKRLEEYLLKICSGDISGGDDDAHFSINFAEAALLLQGSIQVYSRKVEYLYSLVLQALDSISQKRTQDQEGDTSVQAEASTSGAAPDDDDDQFWCSDDIPVEAKNILDSASNKDAPSNRLVKPPANLVVLEGDCLDSTADGGELDTYLLAANSLYRDFILLDPRDATEVDDFLMGEKCGEGKNGFSRESSMRSKGRKTFQSPTRPSARKSSARKGQNDAGPLSPAGCQFEHDAIEVVPDLAPCDFPQTSNNAEQQMDDDHHSDHADYSDHSDSDELDPWKLLNPHESGNFKVKPFRKVALPLKPMWKKQRSTSAMFPLAKLNGPASPELMKVWETRVHARNKNQGSQPPTYFEKLRRSLVDREKETHSAFHNPNDDEEDNDDGFNQSDGPEAFCMDGDETFHQQNHDDFAGCDDDDIPSQPEEPPSQATLEDLCRSHLDALLSSIAESEHQTEMAARVSSWKQRIEHDLEEQDSHPQFDIHEYGERILEKLSLEDGTDVLSFGDIVKGQQKHDIARTFSAMLQLVNNEKVDLDKRGAAGEPICYTAVNPFYVQLLSRDKRPDQRRFPQSKKRPKSPGRNETCQREDFIMNRQQGGKGPDVNPSISNHGPNTQQRDNNLLKTKLRKPLVGKLTPEGKRRRRSRLADPVKSNG